MHSTSAIQTHASSAPPFLRLLHATLSLFFIAHVPAVVYAQPTTVKIATASEEHQGSLNSLSIDRVVIARNNERLPIAVEQIESIDFQIPSQANSELNPSNVPLIQLKGDSRLLANSVSLRGQTVIAQLKSAHELAIPIRKVKLIQFRSYSDRPELSRQLQEILSNKNREGDALIANRDGQLNPIEGIAGDLENGRIQFTIGDRTAEVSVDKIDGVLPFHATTARIARPKCKIQLIDNSEVYAIDLNWNAPHLAITTNCGTEFSIHISRISSINFSTGRAIWLSDLTPSTNDWSPLLASASMIDKLRRLKIARANKSYSGNPLSLNFPRTASGLEFGRKQFDHGFAIQSGGRLAFNLDGQFQKLTGLVGFCPSAGNSGNLVFRIRMDGKTVIEQEMIAQEMHEPLVLDLNVASAERIVFEVDYHDGRSIGDQLNLVDLKVTR